MELSSEDTFRLNVLLATKPLAIRIDESKMLVYGLSDKGEAKVSLNPVGREDNYLRKVRELVSGHLTGSPGGYPVFLKRWTRMGQMRDESLEQLLLLGEPEAIVAAVCSPGLTDELARRAWWAMQEAENARRMLQNPLVVNGRMGPVLANYLVDYLPFETETEVIMRSVSLVLQPGLIDQKAQQDLWKKSQRKLAYLVGFMMALPDDLPAESVAHPLHEQSQEKLAAFRKAGNAPAIALSKVYSASGQAFLRTAHKVLTKPPTQDVVTVCLDCLHRYFEALRPDVDCEHSWEELDKDASDYVSSSGPDEVRACIDQMSDIVEDLAALRRLSGLGYGVMRPVLRDSDAIGSLMRKKLEPVLGPVRDNLQRLLAMKGATR